MKGSLPIHKHIQDVYKYLSHNTQYTHNTHNTHNPYVYGIGEESTTEFSVVLLLLWMILELSMSSFLCYMYCRGTRSEKPQKIS